MTTNTSTVPSTTPAVPKVTTPPAVAYTSYYPRTEYEYGIKWQDGEVTKTQGATPLDAVKLYTNSLRLARIGAHTREFFLVGVVRRPTEKPSAKVAEWVIGEWEPYSVGRDDMLSLYRNN